MIERKKYCGIDIGPTTSVLYSGGSSFVIPTCVSFTRRKLVKTGESALDVLRQERILAMKSRSRQESNVFTDFLNRGGRKDLFSSNMEQSFSGEELLSIIIHQLTAESGFEKDGQCVFTVPSSASSALLLSLKQAAISAGLKNVSFMLKPLAACYASGLPNPGDEARWLIVDFGRDSLEVTLADVTKQSMSVTGSSFSETIGGGVIDKLIVDECFIPHIRNNYHLSTMFSNPEQVSFIKDALLHYAVKAKEAISQKEQVDILSQEDEFGDDDCGTPVELDVTVTKTQLESLETPVFNRAVKFISAFLLNQSVEAESIDKLIFIGGASKSPLFRRLVKEAVPVKSIAKDQNSVALAAQGADMFARKQEEDANDQVYQEWQATAKKLKREFRVLENANSECGGKYGEEIDELRKSVGALDESPDFNVADQLMERIDKLYKEASYSKQLSAFVHYRDVMFDRFEWNSIDDAHKIIEEAKSIIASGNSDTALLEDKCVSILECQNV